MSTWSCSCVSSGCEAWTHKHTHGTTTVTLAAHAHRGLIRNIFYLYCERKKLGLTHTLFLSLSFLLTSSPTQSASGEGSEVFERIDAQKLAGALENAKTLGTMEVSHTSTQLTLITTSPHTRARARTHTHTHHSKKGFNLTCYHCTSNRESRAQSLRNWYTIDFT